MEPVAGVEGSLAVMGTAVFSHKVFKKVWRSRSIKFRAQKCCLTPEEKVGNTVWEQPSL